MTTETPFSQQIDAIINLHDGWKADMLKALRTMIVETNPAIVEEVKWKMRTRPEGLPVWSSSGIICFAEIWKDNVKLLFPKGAQMKDTQQLFNARLKSSGLRAIEFHEGDKIDKPGIQQLVRQAIAINQSNKSK